MSRIMRSVFSPSNLRIVFSADGLVPLVDLARLSKGFSIPINPSCTTRGLARNGVRSTTLFQSCRSRVTGSLVDQRHRQRLAFVR